MKVRKLVVMRPFDGANGYLYLCRIENRDNYQGVYYTWSTSVDHALDFTFDSLKAKRIAKSQKGFAVCAESEEGNDLSLETTIEKQKNPFFTQEDLKRICEYILHDMAVMELDLKTAYLNEVPEVMIKDVGQNINQCIWDKIDYGKVL